MGLDCDVYMFDHKAYLNYVTIRTPGHVSQTFYFFDFVHLELQECRIQAMELVVVVKTLEPVTCSTLYLALCTFVESINYINLTIYNCWKSFSD